MDITFEQLKERIDKRTKGMVKSIKVTDRIGELVIGLLDFEMISYETYQKTMNYVFLEKEW